MSEIQKHGIDSEKIDTFLESLGIVRNLTKGEIQQFKEISIAFGLNPFKREIHVSKYGDNFSIVVGYEVYIKRAERSGLLSGWNIRTEGVNDPDANKNTLKGIVTIYRKDFEHPFVHEVFFNEYVQRKRDGTINKFWREKPITMIKKVATAQGFRLCFSDELGGIPYTKEEIEFEEGTAEVLESKPLKKKPSPEDIRKKEIAEKIKNAQTNEDLVSIWKNNADLHSNKKFEKTIKDRKEELIKEGKIVPKEKPKVEEKPKHSAVVAETKELIDAETMKSKIEKCESEDDLLVLVQDEKRREILVIAQKKMTELQSKQK